MKVLSLLLISVLALPAVAAQDGCDEGEPCEWIVQVDEEGLSAPGGEPEGTVGDWFAFEFNNLDPEASHTITWSLDSSSWQVPSLETVETEPFGLFEEGTYTLTDQETGDTLAVAVSLDDVTQDSDQDEGGGQGTPAPGAMLVLALVGAVLWVRCR